MKIAHCPRIETVGLEIRSFDGSEVLFTTDGKLLAGQADGKGFVWYYHDGEARIKTFRATFVVDNRTVSHGKPYEAKP
jgi:hypothetical protein